MKLNLILITFLMTSCTIYKDKIVYVQIPIKNPQKPDIPKISAEQLQCLSDDTKNLLVKRDSAIKSYIYDLEDTIQSTK
jgi:hypothetical protein